MDYNQLTEEEAIRELAHQHMLHIRHPKYDGLLVVERMVDNKFEAWWLDTHPNTQSEQPIGLFAWGEFAIVDVHVVIWDVPHEHERAVVDAWEQQQQRIKRIPPS